MTEGGRDLILFLERNRIFAYAGGEVMQLDLPTSILRDLDIVDKSAFNQIVDAFIKNKRITPMGVWLVLAESVCFSKDIDNKDTVKSKQEIKDFLEAVPFDQVISKYFKTQTGIRVVATNFELVEAIVEIFEREGFVVDGVVPAAIFPGFGAKRLLDIDFAKYVLAHRDLGQTANMLPNTIIPKNNREAGVPEKPQKNKMLPYLVGVFVALFVVLTAVLFFRK